MGVCTADVDGDGWQDIYVTGLGGNRLYRNNHDGTFADVTDAAGVAGGGWSAGCGFADYDRDGDLDLFVSRYVKIDLKRPAGVRQGQDLRVPRHCRAVRPARARGESRPPVPQRRRRRFTEVAAKAGVSRPARYFGLGIAWFDANADGWLDLYVGQRLRRPTSST